MPCFLMSSFIWTGHCQWGIQVFSTVFEHSCSPLTWLLHHRTGLKDMVHYPDDFLFLGPAQSGKCAQLQCGFIAFAIELGVLVVYEKTEGPSMVLIILGIMLETVQQTSRLSQLKLPTLGFICHQICLL